MRDPIRRLALAALLAGLPAWALATGVEIARNEAEQNAKSPAGKRYEGTLLGKIDEWLRPAVEKCAKDVAAEDRIGFDALVRVGADGKAEEVLFGPETAVARCVAPTFQDQTYPRPPEPSWWVKLEVRMK
ncbi:MAG TPA: hypothetical protein VH854_15585 [Thermoanaerobaculia bacterium]|nr:hypothetical protein [Thermoanaerobaculia bacterium]